MYDNELKIKISNSRQEKDIFKKVPVSELRLTDDFMKHRPKTDEEKNFKKLVETAIKKGLTDFWRPVCDPSFNDAGRICYEHGMEPARGKSYEWWQENAKKFAPQCGSRLGTRLEYVAFLAVLIKELVASGKSIEWAWNAVCNDSKELGHYWNSKNAKHTVENTGNREICGFFDLANTHKLLTEDENANFFWVATGNYHTFSDQYPLAVVFAIIGRSNVQFCSCGWLVFDRCPDC